VRTFGRFLAVALPAAIAAAIVAAIGARAGTASPAVATTPLPAILDVTTSDLPKTADAAVEIRHGTVAPGGSTIWHSHPSPPFVYVESGSGTWEYKDGRASVTRGAGSAIEEQANVVTRIVNAGTAPLQLVIFQVSKPGDPVLVPAQ
jgi:quercetin dioxygenase-like cupin family protein